MKKYLLLLTIFLPIAVFSTPDSATETQKNTKKENWQQLGYNLSPKSITVHTTNQKSVYSCSELSKSAAYFLLASGHFYLDKDADGRPCEWGKVEEEHKSNCHYVDGHYRKNGSYVSRYIRCRADESK